MSTGAELAAVGVELIPGIVGSDNITIGTSTITGATNGNVLFNNSGLLGQKTVTGSGSVVLQTSPTLITPVIGAATGASLSVTTTLTAFSGTAIQSGGVDGFGIKISSAVNFGIFFGSGAPTLHAAQGSLYLRSDGTTINNRCYINSDGSNTWVALTTSG